MNTFFENDLVIYDLETTSVVIDAARIIEIGAFRLHFSENRDPDIDEFCMRVNPQIDIPPTATAVHGITNDDLKDEPLITEVLPQFFAFGGDSIYTAYNLPYDDGVVAAEIKRHGIYPDTHPLWRFDLRKLVMRLLNPNEITDTRLETVGKYFKVDTKGAHSALVDVAISFQVLKSLVALLKVQGFKDMSFKDWIEEDYLLSIYPFGKHKGKHFRDLPASYLQWALSTMTDDVLYTVKHYLNLKFNGFS